ncbi:MAG: hypothetical protein IJS14_07200 [Lentisphaeria bacterium]|nr:hypothetical protein [Lentisphaeria bacterium]
MVAVWVVRCVVPLLTGAAVYAVGGSPAWSIGSFLLTGAFCFPCGGSPAGKDKFRPVLGFTCSEKVRKWVYPVIFLAGFIVFFSVHQNSDGPGSWKYDRVRLDLKGETETVYSRKVRPSGPEVHVVGNFTKESIVEADGRRLKRTTDHKQFAAEPAQYYFDAVTYIAVSPEFRQLTAATPRKIIRKLAHPGWLFVLLMFLCLWSSCCETGLLPAEASPVRAPDKFLIAVLAVASIAIITWMYGQLVPIKYTMDGPHYLSFTAGNPIPPTLLSYRTPGYPLLLKGITWLSPMNHNALIVVQYGLYFLALCWMLYELHRFGLPSAGCLALQIVFARYMFCYHNFMLADSPGLSGLILLLAFGLAWCRRMSDGCSRCALVGWYVFGILLVFAQLMIKPFPGTIFIPGGLAFLFFLYERQPGRAFRHTIIFTLAALVLPLLFCGYRYRKTGDFNFASLASFQMCSTAIILHDPARTAELDAETRRDMEIIVSETLKANPELVWPIDLDRLKSPALDYETYANRIMYHPGIRNGSWLRNKNVDKAVSADVGVELACKKLLSRLLPCVDRRKFFRLQRAYICQLGAYLRYPPMVDEKFAENSPFGKAGRILFLFLLPVSAALWLGRRNRKIGPARPDCNFRLMFLFAVLAFLGACGTISTFALVTPFVEVRRELIGLFSIFFGAFGLIVYSFWYLGACFVEKLCSAVIFRGEK